MPSKPSTSSARSHTIDPVLLGTVCGVVSALGYTAANICLRQVAVDGDPIWVSCIKAVPVATVASCVVATGMWRGKKMFPPFGQVVLLVLSGIFMQLAGNVAFQWALGSIGLAVTVPLSFGCMLLGAALLGRIWLLEPITRRSAVAMFVLLASITILSLAARTEGTFPGGVTFTWVTVLAGVAAAGLSGIGYAAGNVVIRRTLSGAVNLSATLLLMSMTGVIGLGLLSVQQMGVSALLATDPADFLVMLGAGVFNAIAFYSLAKALQLMPVVQVNLLTASQVAMAAVAGVLLFGEAVSAALVVGVLLTTVGLLLMKGRETEVERIDPATELMGHSEARQPTAPIAWSGVSEE